MKLSEPRRVKQPRLEEEGRWWWWWIHMLYSLNDAFDRHPAIIRAGAGGEMRGFDALSAPASWLHNGRRH